MLVGFFSWQFYFCPTDSVNTVFSLDFLFFFFPCFFLIPSALIWNLTCNLTVKEELGGVRYASKCNHTTWNAVVHNLTKFRSYLRSQRGEKKEVLGNKVYVLHWANSIKTIENSCNISWTEGTRWITRNIKTDNEVFSHKICNLWAVITGYQWLV